MFPLQIIIIMPIRRSAAAPPKEDAHPAPPPESGTKPTFPGALLSRGIQTLRQQVDVGFVRSVQQKEPLRYRSDCAESESRFAEFCAD